MALTDTQRVSLFQILEMPIVPYVNHLPDYDKLNIEKWDSTNSPRQAIAALDAHLAYLAASLPNIETELKTLLDRWYEIGTIPVTIQSGSIGSMSGITLDFDVERRMISERVKTIVPFWRKHDEIEHLRTSSPTITVIR